MPKKLIGRRVYAGPAGSAWGGLYLDPGLTKRVHETEALGRPGDYWFWDGEWYGVCPTGYTCGLAKHQVQEHPNGTITVQPSIIVYRGEHEPSWHGFLIDGVWEECQ